MSYNLIKHWFLVNRRARVALSISVKMIMIFRLGQMNGFIISCHNETVILGTNPHFYNTRAKPMTMKQFNSQKGLS